MKMVDEISPRSDGEEQSDFVGDDLPRKPFIRVRYSYKPYDNDLNILLNRRRMEFHE